MPLLHRGLIFVTPYFMGPPWKHSEVLKLFLVLQLKRLLDLTLCCLIQQYSFGFTGYP
jgi:hypothetical protein